MKRPARAVAAVRQGRMARAYCELDRWSFDPRYTEGRCPICGWAPPGAPSAPAWVRSVRKFEWELTGLFVLLVVLAILGVLVARAAGYNLPTFNVHAPARGAQVASPARTGLASPSPSHRAFSPTATTTPSPKK